VVLRLELVSKPTPAISGNLGRLVPLEVASQDSTALSRSVNRLQVTLAADQGDVR
jgi:hypothetical protein